MNLYIVMKMIVLLPKVLYVKMFVRQTCLTHVQDVLYVVLINKNLDLFLTI